MDMLLLLLIIFAAGIIINLPGYIAAKHQIKYTEVIITGNLVTVFMVFHYTFASFLIWSALMLYTLILARHKKRIDDLIPLNYSPRPLKQTINSLLSNAWTFLIICVYLLFLPFSVWQAVMTTHNSLIFFQAMIPGFIIFFLSYATVARKHSKLDFRRTVARYIENPFSDPGDPKNGILIMIFSVVNISILFGLFIFYKLLPLLKIN